MLSKRIFVLVFVVVFLNLMVGCDTTTPEIENLAPTIESDPVTTAKAGMEYTYDVDATDPNGDTLTYSLTTNPSGMTINSLTGLITWTPAVIGGFDVTVNVSDGILSTTQSFNISVTDRIPMEITVNLPTFKVDEPCWFTVSMVANDDLDKLVVASLEWPTSLTDGDLEGTLETDEESDLAFALTGGLFQTDPFIMGDVTANFRGTFDVAGTYSTTVEVKTTDGTLLCSKDIEIVVVEQAVAEQLVVIQNSGQNDINRAADHPYIDWTINGSCIDFEFVNPTAFLFAFDYRVDREIGTITEWSNIIIGGGELAGEEIGPSYNIVNVSAGSTETVHVCVEEEVWVGLRLGPENNWFLDWIKFEVQ